MPQKMNMQEKTYLRDRADEEFRPVIMAMNDRLIPVKRRIREKVEKELGVPQIEKQMRKMIEAVEKMDEEYREVTGHGFSGVTEMNSRSMRQQQITKRESPLSREVDKRLKATKEAQSLVMVEADMRQCKDQVMLAGFPEDVRDLFENMMPELLAPYRKEVGLLNGK